VLAIVVGVAVIGLAFAFDHAQHSAIERTVKAAASDADDVGDPPPGVLLAKAHNGVTTITPGAPDDLAALAFGHAGPGSARSGDQRYLTYLKVRDDGSRFLAAYDLSAHHEEELRLVWTSLVAGLMGIVLAASAGLLIGRRAVRPMAQALTLQRRFVTDASHELRTPLTVLHTRAQMVRRRLRDSIPPEQVRDLDQLIVDTSTLGEVVSDLLLSAQLPGDQMSGEPVDVGELAASMVRSLCAYAETNDTSLSDRIEPGSWLVIGARGALRRALGALVDNAISHTPGGSVLIAVSGDEEWVRISVIDNGEGFDPAEAHRLTDRFSRGRGAGGNERRFGLGLALVDEVVRAHDGRLELTGLRGRGATISMVLPRA
jgi:signal transduction histidine kinase